MAKPLSELLKKVSSEVKAEASAQAVEMLAELSLFELRVKQGKTQADHLPDGASTSNHAG